MTHLLTYRLKSRGVYYTAGTKTQIPHKNSTNTTQNKTLNRHYHRSMKR